MDWIYIVTTGLSSLAAILAWVAKILWSKEHEKATEQVIKAKDAQIEQLKSAIEQYKELNPLRLKEYHEILRSQLEEYNDNLKEQLEKAGAIITQKENEIKELKKQGENQNNEILEKEHLYKDYKITIRQLKLDLNNYSVDHLDKFIFSESFSSGNGIQSYCKNFQKFHKGYEKIFTYFLDTSSLQYANKYMETMLGYILLNITRKQIEISKRKKDGDDDNDLKASFLLYS